MDVDAVRQGLAAAADAVPGLNCTGYVPDSIAEPVFFPAEVDISYDRTFRGMDEITVTCRVLVGRADDEESQALLNAYLSRGGKSVKRAIEGTPGVAQTLGGACDDVHVMRVQGYRYYQHNGVTYLGAELVVRVIGGPEPEE